MQDMNLFKSLLEDKTYLKWSVARESSGTAGSFLKSYEEIDEVKHYYKLSNFSGTEFTGHESLNEIVCCNVLSMLGIEHLRYKLVYGSVTINNKIYDTLFTDSIDFKKADDKKLTLEAFYALYKNSAETPLQFIQRIGYADYFYAMFLFDWLVYNRDRHGANIEVLYNVKEDSYRLAPLFDNGLSLMFSCYDYKAMKDFNYLADNQVNNFVGSKVLSENLKLVPNEVLAKVERVDYNHLFDGLKQYDYLIDSVYFECIEAMIKERVEYVKKILTKR